MKVQFATMNIADARSQVEPLLNNGWYLHSWKVVNQGVDANNIPAVFVAVCLMKDGPESVPELSEEDA